MEQIRPFPPTDLIDRAEEQEAILLAPAVDLKDWVIKNWLTIGGELHNPDHDHIAELLHDDENFLAFAGHHQHAWQRNAWYLANVKK
jgi:hypothetical protein